MGSRLGHAEAFPKRQATQCLVPYSENKGYASNPRRFFPILGFFDGWKIKDHSFIFVTQIKKFDEIWELSDSP